MAIIPIIWKKFGCFSADLLENVRDIYKLVTKWYLFVIIRVLN